MTPEEFIAFLRKTKSVIDDATSCQGEVGIGTFLTYWDKYKHYIFQGYTQECLDSTSFRDYVWHMMCMTKVLDKQIEKDRAYIPKNVINFYDYQQKKLVG